MGVVWGLALALAGMTVGAMLAAIFFRVRLHDVLEAAVSHGRESLQIDLATHVERLRALEAEALQGRQELLRLRQEADTLQRELEMAGHHRARLSERAARVPALEAQARRLTLQLRMTEEEMRRLAASEARQAQALASRQEEAARQALGHARLDEAIRPVRDELDALRRQLAQVLQARHGQRPPRPSR